MTGESVDFIWKNQLPGLLMQADDTIFDSFGDLGF